MNIKKIDTKTMTATLSFKYEELRCLSNLLYTAHEHNLITIDNLSEYL